MIEKETQAFTAEFAENAEKKNLDNLCVLSDLCGEITFGTVSDFMMSHTRFQVLTGSSFLPLSLTLNPEPVNAYNKSKQGGQLG